LSENGKSVLNTILLIGLVLSSKVLAETPPLPSLSINPLEFEEKLREFTGAADVQINGRLYRITERKSDHGRDLARQWLNQEYQKIGFNTYLHVYGSGSNFIAEKTGKTKKIIVVSSHLDSVGNAGADDDGSGIIAALLISKALSQVANNFTLRVIAFDQEEEGFLGSEAYLEKISTKDIVGDIQLEMIAYNSKKNGHFNLVDCKRPDSMFLGSSLIAQIQGLHLPLTVKKSCSDESDHGSFWRKNIPAIAITENFFGGDGDSCYHSSCDVVDNRLNFQYASSISSAVAKMVYTIIK